MPRPSTLTTSDASGGAVNSSAYTVNIASETFAIGFGVVVTGTATYTVQHTFDEATAASQTWFDHDDIAGETTSQDGNYAFPCRQIRLRQTAGDGSCVMTIIQSG